MISSAARSSKFDNNKRVANQHQRIPLINYEHPITVTSDDSLENDQLVTIAFKNSPWAVLQKAQSIHSLYHPNENILKLNISGNKYYIRPTTILKRGASLLSRFVTADVAQRLCLCDDYIEETTEYVFARSTTHFEPIYRYLVSGQLHKPKDICFMEFLEELKYWEISAKCLAQCCWEECAFMFETPQPEPLVEVDKFVTRPHARIRRILWNLIEEPESSWAAKLFAFMSIGFVILSNAGLILSSLPAMQIRSSAHKSAMVPLPIFIHMEQVCVIWFTMEYLTKMVVAVDRWRLFKQTLNLIDLLAILPFYFELSLTILGIDLEQVHDLKGAFLVIRILRVLRVVRIFKLGRYSSGLQNFAMTLMASMKQLGVMAMVLGTGVVFFSTLVYYLEKDEVNTKFTSIPATFWWCTVTMTTVGSVFALVFIKTIIFIDMAIWCPKHFVILHFCFIINCNLAGKLVASGAIACGVLVLALPITIIVDNFMKVSDEPNNTEGEGGSRRFGRG